MIKAPKNWDDVHATSDRPRLDAGGYVVKILEAEDVIYPSGWHALVLNIDILEGDKKDYYKDDYRAQQDNPKWRGVVRLGIPVEDAPADDRTARNFKGSINAIEHSNEGYTWNWDETSLKGKTVGCLFRSEEYEFDGRNGWTVRPFMLVSADRIREGKYSMPNPKPLKGNAQAQLNTNSSLPSGFEAISDDDIPF